MRYHLQHPTQSAACGTNHTALTLSTEAWKTKPEHLRCKRCAKALTALEAGRPVYSGLRGPLRRGADYQRGTLVASVKTFKPSERCQDCGAFKREHIGFALVCPPLPESRPVPDQRNVREPKGAPRHMSARKRTHAAIARSATADH